MAAERTRVISPDSDALCLACGHAEQHNRKEYETTDLWCLGRDATEHYPCERHKRFSAKCGDCLTYTAPCDCGSLDREIAFLRAENSRLRSLLPAPPPQETRGDTRPECSNFLPPGQPPCAPALPRDHERHGR